MNKGIWEIGRARLCPRCQADMAPEYVMRCDGQMLKTTCERCGKITTTMVYRYTMNKNGLAKIGRMDG